MKSPTSLPCPCGRSLPYASCCAPLHAGAAAADAESLMRSRYSAYVLQLEDYLLQTWHPSTRPAAPLFDEDPALPRKGLGLEVRRSAKTGANSAIVEFVARCRIGGRAQRLHETSRFERDNGRWLYVDGDMK